MTEVLHWFLITSRIQYKIILLVSKSQLGLAPNISLTLWSISSASAHLLRSTYRFCPSCQVCLGSMSWICCDWSLHL